jgi:hypothetical protein
LAMMLTQIISPAQQTGVNRTATSTITTRNDKERGVVVQITNRRFTFTNYYPDKIGPDEQFPTIMLLEEFTSERSLMAEGQEGKVKVEAWAGKDANASKKMWTIEHEGDEGAIADRFYKVTKWGCCAAENTDFYFNLVTGQKVFASTADIFQIEVPNTSSAFNRYVAFHSIHASVASAEGEKDQSVIGVIQYGSETKPLSRIILRSKTEAQQDMRLEKIKARYQRKLNDTSPLTLWGVDGKAAVSSLTDFSIILSFYENVQIEIPVTNDQPQLSRAVLPKGLTLQLAK